MPDAAPPTAPPRRRRWRRRLAFAGVGCLLAVLALPYSIALGPVRDWLAGRATAQLGARCRIEALAWSWRHGITATGVEVANPAGFTADRPCLRIRHATVDTGPGLTLAATVRVDGLVVGVEQAADGTTNVQQLGRRGAAAPPGSGGPPTAPATALPFDFALTDGRIELRRDGRLLETATDVRATATRARGATSTNVTAAATIAGGRTSLALVHGDHGGSHAELTTAGLTLAAWAPLLDAALPGAVTTLDGRAEGAVTADLHADGRVELRGSLAVVAPRLGGPLLRGARLGGERWTLTPDLTFAPGTPIDASRFALDLGWFRLRGAPPPAAAPTGTLAATCELDIAALATEGGPLPAWLRGTGARLGGELRLATTSLPTDAAGWARALAATLRLDVPRLTLGGFTFRQFVVDTTLRDGTGTLASIAGASLDDGPLALSARVDLTQPATLPLAASLRWQGGQLHGGTAALLRYLVPLLAGAEAGAATLTGRCDLELTLAGPALRATDQGWLAWLDAWQGSGELGLHDAAVTPAAALQPLLAPLGPLTQGTAPLGDHGRFALDGFTAPFAFAQGAVRTTAAAWLAKGRRLGLAGSVRFDGGLDYELDLTELLRGHRDGEKVLQALRGTLPPALLRGTLDAPTVELPALTGVLQRVLEEELKQRGKGLLDRALDDLLRRR
ncbi:MAG: hypothetical protein JNL08_04750 [Planctomycetes bacterium]|nr:hypothetical protein [Planctomycetota bacterium]